MTEVEEFSLSSLYNMPYVRWGVTIVLAIGGLWVLWKLFRFVFVSDETDEQTQIARHVARGQFKVAGDMELKRGNYSKAATYYQRAGEFGRQARALLRGGETKAAAEAFLEANEAAHAAELFAEVGEHARAAELYIKSPRPEDRLAAVESYLKAKEFERAGRILRDIGDFERAAEAYSRVPFPEPPDLVVTLYEQAAETYPQGDEARTRHFQRAAELSEKLGLVERAARDYERASALCDAARLYEGPLARPDIASALYHEGGDRARSRALHEAAGGTVVVLRLLENRALSRGDTESAIRFSNELAKVDSSDMTDGSRRYQLQDELGRGGMGVVYRAWDKVLSRTVALKFLPDSIGPDNPLFDFFRQEARAAAALSHPAIVTVYDFGKFENRSFIAMEFLEGLSLDKLVRQKGRLRPDYAMRIFYEMLGALAVAHDNGIVHRDIKPANIMLLKRGGVKLMDFGVAKIMGARAGKGNIIAGTPPYAPPEQLKGVTNKSVDVHAAGVTLYYMLAGGTPATTPEKMLLLPIESVSKAFPDVDPRLDELLARCVSADPTQRPQSAGALLQLVENQFDKLRGASPVSLELTA